MSTTSATLEAAGAKAKKIRRSPMFKGKDRLVFYLMIIVPTTLHVLFVWVPTLASIFFSFTDFNGIRFGDMEVIGFRNFWEIFTVFEKDFFQAVLNNLSLLVFLFVGPTIFGMGLAYLLDKRIKGSRVYQSVFYTPVVLSLAVVGFMWQSVIYSTENGLATALFGWRRCRRLDRQPAVPLLDVDQRWRVRTVEELPGDPGRHCMATHRVHHGAVPRRIEERRPFAEGGGLARRRHRVAVVPSG